MFQIFIWFQIKLEKKNEMAIFRQDLELNQWGVKKSRSNQRSTPMLHY